jgi:hypothetical protein
MRCCGDPNTGGTLAAERAILAEVLAMRTILLNFMLKVGEGTAIPEESSKKLIAWADANKMKRALEILVTNSAREQRMQTAAPEPIPSVMGTWNPGIRHCFRVWGRLLSPGSREPGVGILYLDCHLRFLLRVPHLQSDGNDLGFGPVAQTRIGRSDPTANKFKQMGEITR